MPLSESEESNQCLQWVRPTTRATRRAQWYPARDQRSSERRPEHVGLLGRRTLHADVRVVGLEVGDEELDQGPLCELLVYGGSP